MNLPLLHENYIQNGILRDFPLRVKRQIHAASYGLNLPFSRVSSRGTFVKESPHRHVHMHFISVAVLCYWMKRNRQSIHIPSALDCTHAPCAEPFWHSPSAEEGTVGWGMVGLTPVRKATFDSHIFCIVPKIIHASLIYSLWHLDYITGHRAVANWKVKSFFFLLITEVIKVLITWDKSLTAQVVATWDS